MANLPSGTVTFLFTDVEGSTRLWERDPDAMGQALARHDAIVEDLVAEHHGAVVRPRGEGDSRFVVFARATDAVAAAAAIQQALHVEPWPQETPLRVRMALHTGEADLRDGDYYGSAANRCARLRAIAHGGQTLLSLPAQELVRDALPAGVRLTDAGEHRLSDLSRPERIFHLLHPDLPADFPPLRSLDVLANNLPAQLTSFIGRERELSELTRLLAGTDPSSGPRPRLLTLTGTGGCGKTRLALQTAADLLPSFPDGAWQVELAPLADPNLVPHVVATALGVRETPGQPILPALLSALKSKRLLLVLDNCEHLLDACARLADAVLRGCPHVQILATSREALGIAGEVNWRVPSLATPPPDAVPPLELLLRWEAVRLFVERAVAADRAFAVTEHNAAATAQVCRRLDGIPLALELAAARVRGLSVEQLAARLDQRFRLLTGGSRTALPRQQTLRAAIDWSYDLLTEPERVLLRRLAVFAGGWSLDGAEAVCAGEDLETGEVLDVLAQLADKSLVLVEARGGEARYRFLETVRAYAREKLLASDEAGPVRSRHCAWYLALADRAWSETNLPGEAGWLDRLEADHDNLLAALEWSRTGEPSAEVALWLASALTFLWSAHGHIAEGQAQLAAVLAMDSVAGIPAAWARALWGASLLAYYQGELSVARSLGERALEIRRSLDDRAGLVQSLKDLGLAAREQGDYRAARAFLQEAVTISRDAGDRPNLAVALDRLGTVAHAAGDHQTARVLYDDSMAIWHALDDATGRAWSLFNQGCLAFDDGDYDTAGPLLRGSLVLRRIDGNRSGLVRLLDACSALAAISEQLVRAVQLAGAASTLRERHGLYHIPTSRRRADRGLDLARDALDTAIYASAWKAGRAMSLEQAIAYALEEAAPKE